MLLVDSDPQGTALDWYSEQPDGTDLPAVTEFDRPVLHKSIRQLTRDYAYIVIDGSAKIAENTTFAIRVADLVLIPARHSGFDLWAVENLVEAIRARHALTGKPAAAFLISAQVERSRLACFAVMYDMLGTKVTMILSGWSKVSRGNCVLGPYLSFNLAGH